ncbi:MULTISPECIES: hypothetical protein [unclassified Microbacterium]|uniref:hypothetical protein n=1 Tax=unclassified Microbacterium TaxID=2609290 RepID=UPI00214BC113|nr:MULTISPECIES: hypothetical protein [unclassified Microbacterium]MCR2808881.1 hypothetical protein [Microbacterium sp. zg.B185]WIM18700.1 hypothetical protein QNO12_14060 [Microbacterium sp. zg-B185]
MEKPKYLERLLRQKVLLIVGFVVAIIAGLLAGLTIHDGAITTRVQKTYTASSTVLLASPQPNFFQVEIPGTAQALPQPNADGTTPTQELIVEDATPLDLADSAIILAYIASSDEVAQAVADRVGDFEDGDGITAARRTTQPAGDERFGGRLSLPLIDIVGTSTSAARAELIANEATEVFADLIRAQQREWGVSEEIRLTLDVLNAPVADSGEGSNPAIPVIVVAVGVMIFFIALALIVEAVRDRRRRREVAGDDRTDGEDEDDAPDDLDESTADAQTRDDEAVPVMSGAAGTDEATAEAGASDAPQPMRRRMRTEGIAVVTDPNAPEHGTDSGSPQPTHA